VHRRLDSFEGELGALFEAQRRLVSSGLREAAPLEPDPIPAKSPFPEGASSGGGGATVRRSSSPRKRPSESAAAGAGVGILVPETRKGAAASPEDSIKGLSIHAFYVSCMENEGALPTSDSKDKVRANHVINWFDCMATAEERGMLMDKSTEAGERRKLGGKLQLLVVARLKDAFKDA